MQRKQLAKYQQSQAFTTVWQAISFIYLRGKKGISVKGLIAPDFPYLTIAKEYESAGAAAISVLTEPEYFLGRDEYLKEIAKTVHIPVLRKDFTIDEYQIYEAKLFGASAVSFDLFTA